MGKGSRLILLVLPCLALTFASKPCCAISDCIYAAVNFSDGAVSCQSGRQFRCSNGTWQDLGMPCAAPPPLPTIVDPADCSCTLDDLKVCDQSGQACCVTLEAGKCTKSCCLKQ
jgi:hypothetical protein